MCHQWLWIWRLSGWTCLWNVAIGGEIPERMSACLWQILLCPIYIFLRSLEFCAIFSSVILSYGRGLCCAHFQSAVFCSVLVPNWECHFYVPLHRVLRALGLLLLLAIYVWLPYKPIFLKSLFRFFARFNSKDFSVRGLRFANFGCRINLDTDLFFRHCSGVRRLPEQVT